MKTASEIGAPVIYAGRFAGKVSESLPGIHVANEWDVLPHQLANVLRRAPLLVILDPLSFPFETMTDDQRNIPLIIMPPPEFDAETLITVFGSILFDRLGPFDRIATANQKLWDTLRRRYSWANSQYIKLGSRTPEGIATEIRPLLESVSQDLRQTKSVHSVEAQALAPRIATLRHAHPDSTLDILELSAGDRHWPTVFDLSKTSFSGIYTNDHPVESARLDFPEHSFSTLAKDSRLARSDSTFDISFSFNFIQIQPNSIRLDLVSEIWRVTRPGGIMIFLEDFVTREPEGEVTFLSLPEFFEFVVEATDGRVILDHVESLLYPGENMFRGGLISLRKTGGRKDG